MSIMAEFEKNGPKNFFFIYIYKNGLRPGDLINVIGTEILRRCSDHVHYGRCVGDIYLNLNLSGLSKFGPTHKKMYMPRKKNLFTFCMLFQMAHWL